MKFIILSLFITSFVYARTGDVAYDYEIDLQLQWENDNRNPANLDAKNEQSEEQIFETHDSENLDGVEQND